MEAVKLTGVSKKFRLHKLKSMTLKDALIGFFRGRYSTSDYWALRDIDLSVDRGDTLGIIGENGSGKTTLLKLVAGIIRPTKGNITVNGEISTILGLAASFHPDLTGRENAYLEGSLFGFSKKDMDRRIGEITDFSGLDGFMDVPVRSYSSGMLARLGFSLAILTDPDIMLVDEIMAVGDAAFQEKCVNRMMDMKKRGKTILFVSHNLEHVKMLCRRSVLLERGKIVSIGDTSSVISEYSRSIMNPPVKI